LGHLAHGDEEKSRALALHCGFIALKMRRFASWFKWINQTWGVATKKNRQTRARLAVFSTQFSVCAYLEFS
jgi:hypothetical protein